MARTKNEKRPGHGRILETWEAPDDAGVPIGCLATSFTFSSVFFEEECLSRFLGLESDLEEDGPLYVVEREEKLAQVICAAALVDQHHCRGARSLRWDLLPVRYPQGILHAKVSLLCWSEHVRIVVGSANLTEDGYRRNLEVYGVLDYHLGGEAPLGCLHATTTFLQQIARYTLVEPSRDSGPVARVLRLLERVADTPATWGREDDAYRPNEIRVFPVFVGPGMESALQSLSRLWRGVSPPKWAIVLSPFFDSPNGRNEPAEQLWAMLRKRGEARIEFRTTAEEIPGTESFFIHAPESLKMAQPQGRPEVSTDFCRVATEGSRPLHAKMISLKDDRWMLETIGSSNFTTAGLGLSEHTNLEANLAYLVDCDRNPQGEKSIRNAFPKSIELDAEKGVKWQTAPQVHQDLPAEELPLPTFFDTATFNTLSKTTATVTFTFVGTPPSEWRIVNDEDGAEFVTEFEWMQKGKPHSISSEWRHSPAIWFLGQMGRRGWTGLVAGKCGFT